LSETIADVNELLLGIATDRAQPTEIRAEALLALSKSLLDDPAVLLPLLDDPDRAVQVEALRALRIHASNERVRARLDREFESAQSAGADRELIEQYEFALFPPGTKADRVVERPESMDEWQHALRTGGDPAAGERLFFAAQTQCAGCHLIDNRGRRIGPELSNLGQSVSREQIVHSILRPGDAFAPEYQAWFVELKDGEYFQGLQLDHKANRGIEMFTTEGITRSFKGPDIEGFGVLPNSLMPDGLEQTMTVGELRDLVAFLESRK
jgi:putative heme-binding domain-containing protein